MRQGLLYLRFDLKRKIHCSDIFFAKRASCYAQYRLPRPARGPPVEQRFSELNGAVPEVHRTDQRHNEVPSDEITTTAFRTIQHAHSTRLIVFKRGFDDVLGPVVDKILQRTGTAFTTAVGGLGTACAELEKGCDSLAAHFFGQIQR